MAFSTRLSGKNMRLIIFCFFVISYVQLVQGKEKKLKQFDLQNKETNIVQFIRLLVMRLVFGAASAMGLGENISGFLGGVFVPPGVDEYEDFGGDENDYVSDLF